MKHIYDIIIIGGGPGGYTAALYGARAGLDTLLLEKLAPGGPMAMTFQIDNYPGFEEGIDGFFLADKMQQQAERFGAKSELAEVYKVDLKADPKVIDSSEGRFYARTVAIATGANPRQLGVPNEAELVGRGVHYCAACDGMFYRNKVAVVVGGGNTAAADALLLSRVAKKVIVVHRRDVLRATKIYHAPLMAAENVEFRWDSAVEEVLFDGQVRGVRIRNLKSGAEEIVDCDGVFVSIGRKPATELFARQVELDAGGYIKADESTVSSVPGVFAVGDVRSKLVRQVVTAVSDGANAVHFAEEYLAEH